MNKEYALRRLELEARRCRRCTLHRGRKQVVFGSGPANADIMLVGEGPGRSEDRLGLPFVGSAGKRLNELMKIASLKRESVYITNVVLCRPPGNRRPLPGEVETCRDFLKRRIAIINPRIIVALGRTAAEALLGRRVRMEECHGRFFALGTDGIALFVTYHPAAALYSGSTWRKIKNDFKKLGTSIGRKPGSTACPDRA